MHAVTKQKKRMRQRIESERAALSPEEHRSRSLAACRKAVDFLRFREEIRPGRNLSVMMYVPFKSELDVKPLAEWAWDRGHVVLVPRVMPANRQMHMFRISGWGDLEAGAWGIPEPRKEAEPWRETADILVVPGLAFDHEGRRLGYGGGYYDRFWNRLTREFPDSLPLKMALSFEMQVVPLVPCEEHDLRVDVLITEQAIRKFGKNSSFC